MNSPPPNNRRHKIPSLLNMQPIMNPTILTLWKIQNRIKPKHIRQTKEIQMHSMVPQMIRTNQQIPQPHRLLRRLNFQSILQSLNTTQRMRRTTRPTNPRHRRRQRNKTLPNRRIRKKPLTLRNLQMTLNHLPIFNLHLQVRMPLYLRNILQVQTKILLMHFPNPRTNASMKISDLLYAFFNSLTKIPFNLEIIKSNLCLLFSKYGLSIDFPS